MDRIGKHVRVNAIAPGIAKDNLTTRVFGLGLSILLMAVAAMAIARTMVHHSRVGHVGLSIILWVAGDMIFDGLRELHLHLTA